MLYQQFVDIYLEFNGQYLCRVKKQRCKDKYIDIFDIFMDWDQNGKLYSTFDKFRWFGRYQDQQKWNFWIKWATTAIPGLALLRYEAYLPFIRAETRILFQNRKKIQCKCFKQVEINWINEQKAKKDLTDMFQNIEKTIHQRHNEKKKDKRKEKRKKRKIKKRSRAMINGDDDVNNDYDKNKKKRKFNNNIHSDIDIDIDIDTDTDTDINSDNNNNDNDDNDDDNGNNESLRSPTPQPDPIIHRDTDKFHTLDNHNLSHHQQKSKRRLRKKSTRSTADIIISVCEEDQHCIPTQSSKATKTKPKQRKLKQRKSKSKSMSDIRNNQNNGQTSLSQPVSLSSQKSDIEALFGGYESRRISSESSDNDSETILKISIDQAAIQNINTHKFLDAIHTKQQCDNNKNKNRNNNDKNNNNNIQDQQLQEAIYQSALEHQQSLQSLTSLIIIDTAKKIKLRSITNYEYLTLIIKDAPWLQAKIVQKSIARNYVVMMEVSIQDKTYIRDEHVILCKKKNEFKQEELDMICSVLAYDFVNDEHYKKLNNLFKFMEAFLQSSKNNKNVQILWNKLIKDYNTITKRNTSAKDNGYGLRAANDAAINIIKTFMMHKIFTGPLAITRKLSYEIFPAADAVEYICDQTTALIRQDNNNNEFMKHHIGNLVMVDIDNMYVIPYKNVIDMQFPNDIEFDLAAIYDKTRRYLGPHPDPQTTTIFRAERNKGIQEVIEKVNIKGCQQNILTFKADNDLFMRVDEQMMDIFHSRKFIQHFKMKNIQICMGYREEDKVKDYLSLKEKNHNLQKEIEELQMKLRHNEEKEEEQDDDSQK